MINNYYQKHKDWIRKEACKEYYNLSEEEKTKSVSIIVNVIKISFWGTKNEASWV